ncbi:MAG: sxtJ [Gammaproteobacteria bacterium]|nr:sxtJ [Gammaproteobacteria bacterium]NIR90084.1 sxtJ [Gammaproteobacteria bacterium]NIU03288.1 sxtJ [Gammaproteobacteria bacterium]NIV50782.1 sxtJ [Gammaproteobacteria bacterium]NIV75368.1 sxtJ [Gammaproteobacteria bacterium]
MSQAIHEIPEADRKGLREFGLVIGGMVAGLFGLMFPWLLESPVPVWPWALGGILGVWALVAPDTLRPVYRLWMRFGLLLNRVTTPIILGVVFFLIITPVGFVMRLAGKDPMARRLDGAARSYRVASRETDKDNMEKPY